MRTWALQWLARGATCIVQTEVNPREMLEAMESYKVTHAFAVPTVLGMLLDELCNPVELLARKPLAIAADERLDDFLGRAFEERLDKVLHRGPPSFVRRFGRQINVSKLLFFVPQVALVLEYPQLGADGGIRRGTGQRRHHLGDGGAAEPMDDVHDLALAPAEGCRFRHA